MVADPNNDSCFIGGNLSLLSDDYSEGTTFPFAVYIYPEYCCCGFSVNAETFGVGTHSIKFSCDVIVVHKIDSKYVTVDWSANYGEPGYIENRTHYVETCWETLGEDLELTDGKCVFVFTMYTGWTYSMSIDGGAYFKFELDDDLTFAVGDISFKYSGTSEVSNPYISTDDLTEASITIRVLGYNIFPLSDVFIPSTVPRWSDLNKKANTANPVFTGSFSQNRKSGTTTGNYSHAEGYNTTASGAQSHAEGLCTKASGYSSHAEGGYSTALGTSSHAKGGSTTASGHSSHTEGYATKASGTSSHAEGEYTEATGNYQHVQGKYNANDSDSKYAHIVGNGTGSSARSNAHTLDWDGNAWFAGDVYVGSESGTNRDDGSKRLATVDEVVPAPATASVGQVIAVKAVDEDGRPTEWEAVDMLSGEGTKSLTLLAEFDFSENSQAGYELTDLDNLTEIYIVGVCNNGTETNSALSIRINGLDVVASGFPNAKTGTEMTDGWNYRIALKYNGVYWEAIGCTKQSGAAPYGIGIQAYTSQSVRFDCGECTTLKFYSPNPIYKPVEGWMKIYGR